MTRTDRFILTLIVLATSMPALSAQSLRWTPFVALPARATALEMLDDSTALVATAEGPTLSTKPALHLVRRDSIVWTMSLDTAKLPYFDYPHGEILDILLLSEREALLAFRFGHARRVDLVTRTSEEVRLSAIADFARSSDGSIVAGSRYRSTDGGVTWDTMAMSTRPVRDVLVLESASGGVYYGIPEYSSLWRSTDGGATCAEKISLLRTEDSLTGAGAPLLVFDEHTVVVGSGDFRTWEGRKVGLYRSSDGGDSWRLVKPLEGAHGSRKMFASEGRIAFVGINDGLDSVNISMTTDAGETWRSVDDGLMERYGIPGVLAIHGGTVLAHISTLDREHLYVLEGFTSTVGATDAPRAPLTIYPNPLRDIAVVRLDTECPCRLRVSDALGQTIFESNIVERNGARSYRLDLSGAPAGAYWLTQYSEANELVGMAPLVVE